MFGERLKLKTKKLPFLQVYLPLTLSSHSIQILADNLILPIEVRKMAAIEVRKMAATFQAY